MVSFSRMINPGINPPCKKRYRRRQIGGTATHTPSMKDYLINVAAGVLNKQKKRIANSAKRRKQKVTKPWVEMGKESGAIKQKGGPCYRWKMST
jgi:hypothetical protein